MQLERRSKLVPRALSLSLSVVSFGERSKVEWILLVRLILVSVFGMCRWRLSSRATAKLLKDCIKQGRCVRLGSRRILLKSVLVSFFAKRNEVRRQLEFLALTSEKRWTCRDDVAERVPVSPTNLEIRKGKPKQKKPTAASQSIPGKMEQMPKLLEKYRESRSVSRNLLHEALFQGRRPPKKAPGQ